MAELRQTFETTDEIPAQAAPETPDDVFWTQDSHLEIELVRAESRRRWTREHPVFGVHPDGLGPTLGQDLARPNPGHDVTPLETDWNEETYDPPT